MFFVRIFVVIALVVLFASCGSSAPQFDAPADERVASAVGLDWVTAWNAERSSFRFQSISQWDESASFASQYGGSNFSADAAGFTAAIASAMHNPALPAPSGNSVLGIWYDSLGDDLE